MNLLILFAVNGLSVSFSSSYITKVGEMIVDLPVAVVFLKPTIEYDIKLGELSEIGISADNFYTSLDCDDQEKNIYVKLGANCFKAGPFYRRNIGKFGVAGELGILRIDIAGEAYGELSGTKRAGPIDEERTGFYGGLKGKYVINKMLKVNSFISFGVVPDGNFWEYGATLGFKPFENREVSQFLKPISLNVGIACMQLGAEAEEQDYSLFFGYYLMGIGYELWEYPAEPTDKKRKKNEK